MILAQCPVCQELFNSAADCFISALPCGHVFHQGCVDRWIKTASTCPQCRVNVKRVNIVARLFFDIVPFPSSRPSSAMKSDCTQDSVKQSQLRDPTVQLYQARSEIERLEAELRETERRLAQQSKLAKDRENEVATLTTLYKESDKLCEQERQRCRGLRTELLSVKQLLRDSEAMRNEAVKLRAEMEDMQSIKKLIGASEEAARELLSRYSLKPDSTRSGPQDFTCNLESLCRWTAILRGELTGAREKSRNYRIELSRLRKLHASAAQRAVRSETALAEKNDQIRALEEQLSLVLNRPIPTDHADSTRNSDEQQPVKCDAVPLSPDLFTTPGSSVKKNHPPGSRFSTPDLLAISPTKYPSTTELQKQLRTPFDNPFRAKSNTAQPPTSLPHARELSPQTPAIKCSEAVKSDRISELGRPLTVQRRPSALYEMAIMRRHLVTSHERPVPLHEPLPHPGSISAASTISHRGPMPCSSRTEKSTTIGVGFKRLNRPTKTLTAPAGASKLSRLDQFLMKR